MRTCPTPRRSLGDHGPVTATAFDVLVVGDANPDIVLRGDVVPRFGQAEQLLDAAELTLGGSAAIVACGLSRLGVRTALVSVTGRDLYGDFVRDALEAARVDTRWVTADPDLPTGLTVVLSAPGDRAILTFPGTIPSLTPAAVESALVAGARHLHVASPFLQPLLTNQLGRVFGAARAAGTTTSLDPNWDPSERWDTVVPALAHVDVLLPNAAELVALHHAATGDAGADDALDVAAAWFAGTGVTIALKDGAAGGRLWTRDGARLRVPALEVDAVDTTGAGDSFDAGYLAGIVEGLSPEECLELAVGAGSLSTRAAGGTGSQADRAELAAARQAATP